MKILVVCQYYAPEPFRITDVCEELARRGHEVMVVTGVPNYPEGRIYSGYEKGRRRDETINGVKIRRCWTIPRKTGAFWRFLNYFSYPFASGRFVRSSACRPADGGNFDVVFINQLSPVMMASAGIVYKKKRRIPAVMYCLDLWPESLTAGGVRRDSMIFRLFHVASRHIYRRMDRILVASGQFTGYLSGEFGINAEKITYLPQYAERLFAPLPYKESDTCDLVFAGNIGTAQSADTILKAAARLREKAVRFHIVGGGIELERLQTMAKEFGIENVTFYGRRSVEEMPSFYAMADAMLITLQADPVLNLTLPGKIQSYMAAGKPIIGAIGGEAAAVIRAAGCGYCGPAEDDGELAENIRRFMSLDKVDRLSMGKKSRAYYEAHFTRELFMDALGSMLREAAGRQGE